MTEIGTECPIKAMLLMVVQLINHSKGGILFCFTQLYNLDSKRKMKQSKIPPWKTLRLG